MSDIKPVFDYNAVTVQHKEAADEIANLLAAMGQEMIAELIKEKFKIVEKPKFPFQETEFVKACSEVGIFCAVQGWLVDGSGNMEFPIISISDDCRRLIELYNHIKNRD
jgi:hypothetical protein